MRAAYLLRLHILFGAIVLIALVLILRLYLLQIVWGDHFAARADAQYTTPSTSLYDRGTLFFEDKDGRRVAAATVKNGYVVAINPTKITNIEKTYRALSDIVPLERDTFFMRAEKVSDPYEEVAHKVSDADADRILALKLPGVQVFKEQWRYYPGGNLAAQTIGFEGYADQARTGLYGLERYYNDTLTREQKNLYANFFAEIFSNIGTTLFAKERARSGDVITSIEPSVQSYLQKAVEAVSQQYQSSFTGGIVIDPKTGSIFAMAATPSFDPNAYGEVEDPTAYQNPFVENVYEMGSIIKPITIAIGLDEGVIRPESTYSDLGYLVLDGYRIGNYDGKGRGIATMQDVLNQSLNTGVAHVVEQTGPKAFATHMKQFGLGAETGIDLPNEAVGLIDNLDSPRKIELATASFGQGIALTPIATVRALSALGNGGILVTPHIAKRIQFDNGASKEVDFPDDERVLSAETSETISRMLVEVVDSSLLGGKVKMDRYSIAAKTGTAQIANAGGYFDDRYLHSFFGYFPAYNPRFLVFLYTVEPKGVRYASETLTMPFMDVTKFLISYYDIPPDR
jgi:cell division protein FtsI (penicillin-binding protein 3)/stage V sporulation protein D (sporulation-specific penicillin-binding protein)